MKRVPVITPQEAAAMVGSGQTLLVGGFGMTGNPVHLTHALAELPTRDLTYIANNVSEPGLSGGRLLRNGQLRKAIGSYFTSNPEAVKAYQAGKLEVQLLPQGTLAEKVRAGGAGIPAFYTATGYGTPVAAGKEVRQFAGKHYILEEAITGDFALIKGWKADWYGNVIYRHTAQNFNPLMATAGRITVVEVEEIVPPGELPPSAIHTPGIYVDRLIVGQFEKRIEQRTLRAQGV